MLPNSLLNHILARHSLWFYSYINVKKTNNCNAFGTDCHIGIFSIIL